MLKCSFVDCVYMECLFKCVAVFLLLWFVCDVCSGALRHSRVTVVSERNTAVRIGHAQVSSRLAN